MELGSEYSLSISELDVKENNVFKYLNEYNAEYFDTGRSALKAILAMLSQTSGTILVPEYMCESVIKCYAIDKVVFYKIRDDFGIDEDDLMRKIDASVSILFVMNYFGAVNSNTILKKIREAAEVFHFIVIEDVTHSLFSSKASIGDYMVASLRKWLPVPGLGVVYSKKNIPIEIDCSRYNKSRDNEKISAMILKNMYISGQLDCNSTYREIFADCEMRIDNQKEISAASDLSVFIAKCFDVNDIINKRRNNYSYLKGRLLGTEFAPVNKIDIETEVPFTYVIKLADKEKRDSLRKYLIDNRIYCAVHWPTDGICENERVGHVNNAKTLLSLPIDQRYGSAEMNHLLNVILSFDNR